MEGVSCFSKHLFVILATIASSFTMLYGGMHVGWTSPSLVKLKAKDSPIPITNDEGSWIAVALFFGIMIGGVIWSVLPYGVSTRRIAMLGSVPSVISWITIAFAGNYYVLFLARLIAGISNALVFCAIPLFLAEISSSEIRGLVVSFIPLMAASGTFLANLIGSYTSIQTSALITLIVPLCSIFFFVFVPDSPYNLIQQNRLEDAKINLKKFRGVDDVDVDFNRIKDAIEEQVLTSTGSSLDLIVDPTYRKALISLLGVRSVYQFSGVGVMNLYSQTIFLQITGEEYAYMFSLIYFLIPIVFLVVSLSLVDCVGRKPLMVLAVVVITLVLVTLTTVGYLKDANLISQKMYASVSTGALLVYIAASSVGLQSASVILIGEIFPSHLKSLASTLHLFYFCLTSIIITKLFQMVSEKFGMQVPFLFFAICMISSIFFIIFCIPETKRKNLEEIQQLLKGKDEVTTQYRTETLN